MKSTGGQHYLVLDQLRGIAAYLVVMWHFLHSASGLDAPVPHEGVPLLAIIDEGHTGVALFMCLSGFLFAKLCDWRRVEYLRFVANRSLRLLPLLLSVFALIALLSIAKFGTAVPFLATVVTGFVLPVWPNGGWSVAVEMQFYLVLPFLLLRGRKSCALLLGLVALATAIRIGVWLYTGTVQHVAYLTIIGRFDQFALGMVAYHLRDRLCAIRWLLPIAVGGLLSFYYWFDWMGGFRAFGHAGYPSPSAIWIVMPTIEGLFYASIIALCDARFARGLPVPQRLGVLFGAAGTYSNSIYLLHFFAVDIVAMQIHRKLIDISGFYPGLAFGALFFLAMIVVGRLSYRCVEQPFLKFRVAYLDRPGTAPPEQAKTA